MISTLIINGGLTFAIQYGATVVGNVLYDVACAIGSYYYESKFKKDDESKGEE